MRNEEQEDGAQDRILDKEIESWKGFEYALREENRLLFNKMLTECQDNKELARQRRLELNHALQNYCLWL
jgi:hypothetical protein